MYYIYTYTYMYIYDGELLDMMMMRKRNYCWRFSLTITNLQHVTSEQDKIMHGT